MAVLSKYSLCLFGVFLLGGGHFFIRSANGWDGMLPSVVAAFPYPLVGRAPVIPRFNILAYEGFISLGDAKTTAFTHSS